MKHKNKIAIKVLSEEHADYPRNAWHYEDEYRMLVKAQEIALKEAGIIQQWIPIEERKPKNGSWYFAMLKGPTSTWVETVYYNNGSVVAPRRGYTSLVTHWMPIPEPK